ncbi:MAG: protease modulator HflC [Pseudomonadota bacterium]
MSNKQITFIGILLLLLTGLANSMYTIDERSFGIEFMFGKIHKTRENPGLYFKIPFIQHVSIVDKRLLNVNIYDSQITCKKDERIIISAFSKLKIFDIKQFYIKLNNNLNTMNHRSKSIIESAIRNIMGRHTLSDLLSQNRQIITKKIFTSIKKELNKFGIDVIDFRIMRSDLPENNHTAMIKQMISERQKEAKKIRATGHELALKIKANGDKESHFIAAEAYEKSQKIKAEGDRLAAEIYNNTYKENEEFYLFLRKLESYKKSLNNKNTTFILQPKSNYIKDLKLN